MSAQRPLIVAVEDMVTASIVGAQAAHIALEQQATEIILFHALDRHQVFNNVSAMLNGMSRMANYVAPIVETSADGEGVLALAERALCAEYTAMGQEPPSIRHEIAEGAIVPALEQLSASLEAVGIVLGARRPHAFGRLTHPDVRARLSRHCACPVFVAALQAAEGSPSESSPAETKAS